MKQADQHLVNRDAMEGIMYIRFRRLLPTLPVFACFLGGAMPIGATAQSLEIQCEISGGGTLYNGDTFMIHNFRLDYDGNVVRAPRPLLMYLTNDRPREAFMGSPDQFTCSIDGESRSFSVAGTGHFRGAPVEFCIQNAFDNGRFTDSFNIKISVPAPHSNTICEGEVLYQQFISDLADGDIEVTGI